MGLSEPHFRPATDNRLSAADWNTYRKLSFAADSGMSATPGPLYGDPEPPGRHSPLTRPRVLSGTLDCSRTFFGPLVQLWFQQLPTAFPKVAFHLTVSTGALASLTTLLSFAHACVVQAACSGLHATPAPFRLGQCPPVASTPAPGSHTSSASRDHSRPVLSRTVRIAPGPSWRQSRPRFPSPRGVPATVAFNLAVPALRYGPL